MTSSLQSLQVFETFFLLHFLNILNFSPVISEEYFNICTHLSKNISRGKTGFWRRVSIRAFCCNMKRNIGYFEFLISTYFGLFVILYSMFLFFVYNYPSLNFYWLLISGALEWLSLLKNEIISFFFFICFGANCCDIHFWSVSFQFRCVSRCITALLFSHLWVTLILTTNYEKITLFQQWKSQFYSESSDSVRKELKSQGKLVELKLWEEENFTR